MTVLRMRILKSAGLVALAMMLSACGWQLRGSSEFPPQLNPIYVSAADLSQPQQALLLNALKRAKAEVVASPDGANRLNVALGSGRTQRLVQGAAGGTDIVQLSMQLSYRLTSAEGKSLVEEQTLSQSTNVELDKSNVLVHEQVLGDARDDLAKGLVRNMIFQLNRL